ncbi:putative proteinase inhibitor I-B-like [Capsicum annuum]|nr:putative proteinase inhibitor I-B-like [Capsicum annuum]
MSLIVRPILLVLFLLIVVGWIYLYFSRNNEPLELFGYDIDDKFVLGFLSLVTIVGVLVGKIWMNIFVSIGFGIVITCIHGGLRAPEDQEDSPYGALLSESPRGSYTIFKLEVELFRFDIDDKFMLGFMSLVMIVAMLFAKIWMNVFVSIGFGIVILCVHGGLRAPEYQEDSPYWEGEGEWWRGLQCGESNPHQHGGSSVLIGSAGCIAYNHPVYTINLLNYLSNLCPILLVLFLIIAFGWIYLYFFCNNELLESFGFDVDDKFVLGFLTLVTIVALLVAEIRMNVFVSIGFGIVILCVHVGLRAPENQEDSLCVVIGESERKLYYCLR